MDRRKKSEEWRPKGSLYLSLSLSFMRPCLKIILIKHLVFTNGLQKNNLCSLSHPPCLHVPQAKRLACGKKGRPKRLLLALLSLRLGGATRNSVAWRAGSWHRGTAHRRSENATATAARVRRVRVRAGSGKEWFLGCLGCKTYEEMDMQFVLQRTRRPCNPGEQTQP